MLFHIWPLKKEQRNVCPWCSPSLALKDSRASHNAWTFTLFCHRKRKGPECGLNFMSGVVSAHALDSLFVSHPWCLLGVRTAVLSTINQESYFQTAKKSIIKKLKSQNMWQSPWPPPSLNNHTQTLPILSHPTSAQFSSLGCPGAFL